MNINDSLLWLPVSETEDNNAVKNVASANDCILEFWDGELAFDDMLQAIEHYGANVDDYRHVLDANLHRSGF